MKKFIRTDGRHRRLEGWPMVFTILTTAAVLVGGLVEFIPLALVESNVPRISTVTPFTPLELAGRDLYIREGCNNCHSQMVRPFRHELERYANGDELYGMPGETIYERPFLCGSKRTGPDLSRVGGKYPDLWHVRHMQDPRSTSPRSLMPPYDWLLSRELDLASLSTKLDRLRTLGTPYSDREVNDAVSMARAQAMEIASRVTADGGPRDIADREIVALVAYLQRLGKDVRAAATASP